MTDILVTDSSLSDNEDTGDIQKSELEIFSNYEHKPGNMVNDVDPDLHFYNHILCNCKYYHDEQIKALNKADHMSILHLNCRSSYANFVVEKKINMEILNLMNIKCLIKIEITDQVGGLPSMYIKN